MDYPITNLYRGARVRYQRDDATLFGYVVEFESDGRVRVRLDDVLWSPLFEREHLHLVATPK